VFTQRNSLTRKYLSVLILLLMSIFNVQMFAQQNADKQEDLFEMSVEELMEVPVDTVHGASKYEQKVTEAPSSVTIITADDIRKHGYRTLADILRSVRSFYTFYDRNYDYVGVRGFGRPGDYDTRILLLLDGHRTNDNVNEAAAIGGDFILDVDLIERVEIIRGPGSSLYGANAFFAVVNVVSKRGSDVQGLQVSGDAASHGTFKERVSYGSKFENGLEMLLSYSNYDSDGQRLYFEEFDDPSTNNGVAKRCDAEQYQNLFSKLSYGDFTLEGAYTSREKRIPTAPWDTVFNDRRTQSIDTYGFVNLKYEHEFEDVVEVMGRVYYAYVRCDGDYVWDYSEDDDPWLVVNKDRQKGDSVGGELQFVKELTKKHKLIWGTEYQDNRRQDQKNYDITGVYLDDERESEQWGIYVQDEFKVFNNLIFNAGVRYDDYTTFGGSTNPRLGLVYNHSEKTALKLLYGQAFRAPSAYELYYNDGDDTQKANPDLEPEAIKTYEVVLEQYIGRGLWGSVAGFMYDIDDLISLETDPADDLLVFKNTDEVKAKGLELELNGKWDNGWRARASYTFVEAEDEDTRHTLSNSPKHLAKANLIVPLLKDKLFMGIETLYTSKVKTLARNRADAFFITNLTIFSENLIKGLQTSVSIYNLFDEKYGNPGSGEHAQDIIDQNGRTVWVSATYHF